MALSSATLRNEMAALTKLGLLEQPHTSAGRVPSAQGYRYYLDHLIDAPKSGVIGIDLGTTNSAVAVMEGGEPVVIRMRKALALTPSVVGFSKTGERLVGQLAKRQAVTNPASDHRSIKRQMGTDYKVTIDDKSYTPQEISAMILQKLKARCRSLSGRARHRGSHHRARLLQRQPASGDQGCRHHRRPERPAYHQRADRSFSGLRP